MEKTNYLSRYFCSNSELNPFHSGTVSTSDCQIPMKLFFSPQYLHYDDLEKVYLFFFFFSQHDHYLILQMGSVLEQQSSVSSERRFKILYESSSSSENITSFVTEVIHLNSAF